MTRFLLLRHGQSEWNEMGRWQGWADPALTPLGRRQAELAAGQLAAGGDRFDTVVCSDLARSRETAEILARALGLGAPRPEPGLREFDVGAWSGLTRPEIEERWPGSLDDWRHGRIDRTPGGEPRDAFRARILAALERLAARHAGRTVLAVSHGGVISTLQRAAGATPTLERLSNLCGRWFHVAGRHLVAGDEVALLDPDVGSPATTPVP